MESVDAMYCESCGARLTPGARFCDSCGAQSAVEQAGIQEAAERQRLARPPAGLDLRTALLTSILLFVILPFPALFSGVPVALGLGVAAVMSAVVIALAIRNQRRARRWPNG